MRVLLIGASGMIGSRVAAEARRRGHEVAGASRSGADGLQKLDASDPAAVNVAAMGKEAVVLAARASRDGVDPRTALLGIGDAVLSGVRKAGVRRLVVVGGSGSLKTAAGIRFIDQFPGIPVAVRAEAMAQEALLDLLRQTAMDLDWTYISPGGMIEPGQRTGVFRVGHDEVLMDAQGRSFISAEDYAVGLVDELEQYKHAGQRINFGY